jgi:hypothetical protein
MHWDRDPYLADYEAFLRYCYITVWPGIWLDSSINVGSVFGETVFFDSTLITFDETLTTWDEV